MSFAFSAGWAQKVEFYTPSTVRIVRNAGSKETEVAKRSLVVIAKPEKIKIRISTNGDEKVYKSSILTVRVRDGRVSFADNKGNVLMSEGEHSFTPITEGPDRGAYRVKQCFSCEPDEGIYGVGMIQNGKMSQRGDNEYMIQTNLNDYAHFYQSIKGYGVFWDNYSPTRFITPKEGTRGDISLESEVGNMEDYYFMYGGAKGVSPADGVIKEMRHLSGKVPMSPLWTFGFHQSRERYKSSAELLEVVRNYRRLGVPFDGIIQDWQYWGSNYTWNAMEFINDEFSNAQTMIDEVHKHNVHMTISIWASFGPETKQFRELKKKGLLLGFETWPQSGLSFWPPRMDYPSGVKCYNPFAKEARDLYWRYLSNMHKMDIDAWWMDSTDPDHHSFKDSDLDEVILNDDVNPLTNENKVSYRSLRNAYSLQTVGGVYDSQRAVDSTKRVFILTRSFFAGQQRTGAQSWSGDIESTWEAFRAQVPLCLNHTLTANPNINTDIGGFFAGRHNVKGSYTGHKNPKFQELYVRWMQFGAFCPMMRSHGTEQYRELYYYGKDGEAVYDALLGAVKLRYRFLPYIYSQAWQVSRNDDSYMRALFMDFRSDRNTWNNNREFMFGHNILVCPVLTPLFTSEKSMANTPTDWSHKMQYEVYLPAGARWYDFWNPSSTPITGGQKIMADAPLAHSPLFVKAGSILTLGPAVQYAGENRYDNVDIVVYPGENAEFTLYEDEGDNYNYEKGKYSTIRLMWNDKSRTLTIGRREGEFSGMPIARTFHVSVAGGTPQKIRYDGKSKKYKL